MQHHEMFHYCLNFKILSSLFLSKQASSKLSNWFQAYKQYCKTLKLQTSYKTYFPTFFLLSVYSEWVGFTNKCGVCFIKSSLCRVASFNNVANTQSTANHDLIKFKRHFILNIISISYVPILSEYSTAEFQLHLTYIPMLLPHSLEFFQFENYHFFYILLFLF